MVADSKARKILKSFPKDVAKYFVKIDNKCKKAKITLRLTSGKAIYSNGRCGGYFDEQARVLAVAIGGKLEDVIPTLEHEAVHCFKQYLNKKSIWYKKGIITGHARFFNYLSGSRIYRAKECAAATIKLELDCERRTLRALKKWEKYVNLSLCRRRANAYVMCHYKMLETGKWPKKSPYNRKILAHCSDTLVRSNSKLPWRLKLAFDRYL